MLYELYGAICHDSILFAEMVDATLTWLRNRVLCFDRFYAWRYLPILLPGNVLIVQTLHARDPKLVFFFRVVRGAYPSTILFVGWYCVRLEL